MLSKSNYKILLTDAVTMLGFVYLSSLLLDYIKPGVISNFFDINSVLILFFVGLIIVLILPVKGYQLPLWIKFLYGLWGLLLLGLFVRVALAVTTSELAFMLILIISLILVWLLAWTGWTGGWFDDRGLPLGRLATRFDRRCYDAVSI